MNQVQKAFLLGYAYACGQRYAKRFWCVVDTNFNENEHPRDPDGKFSSNGCRKKNLPQNELNGTKLRNLYADNINKIRSGKRLYGTLRDVARNATGYVNRSIDNSSQNRVYIGSDFVGEIGRNIDIAERNGLDKKLVAEKILVAISHIDEIIQKGKLFGKPWINTPEHHGDKDFLTLKHTIRFNGKDLTVLLDIKRDHDKPESEHIAYNINPEGSATYVDKYNFLKNSVKDEELTKVFFVIRIRFL